MHDLLACAAEILLNLIATVARGNRQNRTGRESPPRNLKNKRRVGCAPRPTLYSVLLDLCHGDTAIDALGNELDRLALFDLFEHGFVRDNEHHGHRGHV